MARESDQRTIPGIPEPPSQNKTDRAIQALRDLQGGKATVAFVRSCLVDLEDASLLWVSLATRIPEARLREMRTKTTPV